MKAHRLAAAAMLVIAATGDPAVARQGGGGQGGGGPRRLTTVAALHEYPSYFHLENVLLNGELVQSDTRLVLRADEREVPVILNGAAAATCGSPNTTAHAIPNDGPVRARNSF